MPQIIAVRTKDDSLRDTIAVVLSQDSVCLGPDGQPWAGVSLNVHLARSLAERLLDLAKEVESQEHSRDRTSLQSLTQVRSILVFHDGSGQSHRAFALALDLASRSLASLRLVGIYGVRQDGLEPSTLTEDYQWQRGWLERLVQMYSQQAVQAGIELHPILVAANDQHKLWAVLDSSEFDLVVLSRRFSDTGTMDDTSKQLHQSLIRATVLLCP